MGKIIAIAGKGGTGKTTVAALIIKYLHQKGLGPILAVDADPSTNLHLLLGMEVEETVGGIREDSAPAKGKRPASQPLSEFLDYQIQMALIEGEGVDLLAMGRPEGKGCYCAANASLRKSLQDLTSNYRHVVIDNEAGLEHISRQTNASVDVMILVSGPSPRGIMAAGRARLLARELENDVKSIYLILNQVQGEPPPRLLERVEDEGLELAGSLHYDQKLAELDVDGANIFECADDTSIYQNLKGILEKIAL